MFHLLHFGNVTNESIVIDELAETLQLVEITNVLLTDFLIDRNNEGNKACQFPLKGATQILF